MEQSIIAALKHRYKSQLLQVMVRSSWKYDDLWQLGASIAAGVRGLPTQQISWMHLLWCIKHGKN